jgi:hypothetical protein
MLLIGCGIILATVIVSRLRPQQFDARFVVDGDNTKKVDVTGQRLDALMIRILEQGARDGHVPSALQKVENVPEDHLYDAWRQRLRFVHGLKDGAPILRTEPNIFMIWSVSPDGMNNTQDDVTPGRRYMESFFPPRKRK